MEKAESQKQRRMVTGSSIQRKPLSSITNLIPKSHHHSTSFSQSKKPTSSVSAAADPAVSGSSIGSTQTRNRLQQVIIVPTDQHSLLIPQTPALSDSVGDGNHIACTRRQTMLKTSSKSRNEFNGAEKALQSKSLTVPLPDKKNRKWLSKEYVTPQDFIDQQRAYFKEIDDYELQVEEVE